MKELYPLVTTDIALFTVLGDRLHVLLVKRANDPLLNSWALPGGILHPDRDRTLDDTALRVLSSKTRVDVRHLEQIAVVSGAERDPRGWSISVLYYALLASDRVHAVQGESVDAVQWGDAYDRGRPLAFDHILLLEKAVNALRRKVEQYTLPLHLLPERFTLSELQKTCEAILGRPLDKGAFRRRIKDDETLEEVPGAFVRGPQRPAQLYRASSDFRF
jgi:ADP-ribose pyrophosphatase YjhB (NUDIX family)